MEFAVIDLFAGAGGVTTGIEQATVAGQKVALVICAINHDEVAIESHWRNHPHVCHFVEDIRTFNVKNLPKINNPYLKKFLWASLECTNHSNAKGGLSRDADSRTLAEHLEPYIKEFSPDYIGIENVKEFRDWGPLVQKKDKSGKLLSEEKGKNKGRPVMIPDKEKKGIDYKKWINSICSLGYKYEENILNAADFGAHTSRRRLFILFAKEGLPIVWPEPTHDKNGKNGLPKWKPVKECLDFSDKGENIFGRKKNLCENTYKRIYAGLIKYIAKGDESFITKWLGNNANTGINQGKSINDPSITVTTQNRLGLIQAEFLLNYHYRSNSNPVNEPSPTITTHDKLGIVSVEHFIDMQHGNGKQNEDVGVPCGAILPVVKKNLITAVRFIDQQFGRSEPATIEQPCAVLTANPKYNLVQAFLYNPQFQSKGGSINDPCFTLIGKMDKRPPGLVQAYPVNIREKYPYLVGLGTENLGIIIDNTDTEYMRKIKLFMAAYGVAAIYMRMLRIPELKKITGLPDDYILEGTQADQKKFIGNAVPPCLPKAIFETLYTVNNSCEKIKVAV